MLSKANYEILNRFRSGSVRDETGASDRILELCELKYLKPIDISVSTNAEITQTFDCEWAITPAGLDALDEFERITDEKAKTEKDKSFEHKTAVAQIAVQAIMFLLGLLVEHYTGIVEAFVSFFR